MPTVRGALFSRGGGWLAAWCLAVVGLGVVACAGDAPDAAPVPPPRASSALPHAAYIWQGRWGDEVRQAVRHASGDVARWYVLAAEYSSSAPARVPQVSWEALRATGKPTVAVMRVNGATVASLQPYLGAIAERARDVVAASEGAVVEVQIDFDAGVSQLPAYAVALTQLRARLAQQDVSVALTITALPSWLEAPALAEVLGAVDGFTLQVHSLIAPTSRQERFAIIDTSLILGWLAQADRLAAMRQQPWWVALPTYGYQLAFAADGTLLGLTAEAKGAWAQAADVREVGAAPHEVARVLTAIQAIGPQALPRLAGISWFRLPVATDRRNWTMTTWQAVVRGEVPLASDGLTPGLADAPGGRALTVEVVCAQEAHVARLILHNRGAIDVTAHVQVTAQAVGADVAAADGLGHFALAHGTPDPAATGAGTLVFEAPGARRFAAGGQWPIGWVRLAPAVAAAATGAPAWEAPDCRAGFDVTWRTLAIP